MKKLAILLLTVTAALFAARPASAIQTDFPAGSLIIPMDNFYQPEADGGMLEAYGLVFNLLKHTDALGDADITVDWIINEEKTSIDGADFKIEDLTLALPATVAETYDHAGGTKALTFNTANGDDYNTITFSGAPFVISGIDAATAKTVINDAGWNAVDVIEAKVPFSAPVYREMRGTPPKIALMNDSEDKAAGNAHKILESYLRLAGICTDVYDIITPNEIRDGALQIDSTDPSQGYKYDFLWTPHWAGYEKAPYNTDSGGIAGVDDVEEIVQKVREFVAGGNGLLAECASIEVFEHSSSGHFLTDKGIAQNGGWNDAAHIFYNDVTTPNSQIGNFGYEPTGGHLHNWRPFKFGDNSFISLEKGSTIEYMKGALDSPQTSGAVTAGNDSVYNSTVTRFTMDTGGDVVASTKDDNWDYYVGGYLDGDTSLGYVVYLGGHKYANECKDPVSTSGCTAEPEHRLRVTFAKSLSNEQFLFTATEAGGTNPSINFNAADGSYDVHDGSPLELYADAQTTVSGNQINDLLVANLGTTNIGNIDLNLTWGGDTDSDGQYVTEVYDTTTNTVLYTYSQTTSVSGWIPEKNNTDAIASGTQNEYKMKLAKAYAGETFTMKVYHDQGVGWTEFTFEFENKNQGKMININRTSGTYPNLTLVSGNLKKDKPAEAEKILLKKTGANNLTIKGIQITWSGGNASQNVTGFELKQTDGGNPKFKYTTGDIPGVVLGTAAEPTSISPTTPFTVVADCTGVIPTCTDNASCSASNVAGVRYVLNTLFNIKYQLKDYEFSRAAPVVSDQYLYYGTFDYPSYRGHFRKIDVQAKSGSNLDFSVGVQWDAGEKVTVADDSVSKHIKDSKEGNNKVDANGDLILDANGQPQKEPLARQVFTADKNVSGAWEMIDFDKAHINLLRTYLDVTPANGDDSDEFAVINRVRGMIYDENTSSWKENSTANGGNGKRLGAIVHSGPAIVNNSDRTGRIYDLNGNNYDDRNGVYYDVNHDGYDDATGVSLASKTGAWVDTDGDTSNSERLETIDVSGYTFTNGVWERPEVAYVGSLDGMLHAIDTATGDELWSFIPKNLLGKLQNDRTDENAVQDFAAVDSSPTVKEIFYDHDNDPSTPDQWRTILSCAEGKGGTSLLVMDITNPLDPVYIGEYTDGSMGYARRTSIGKVKVPIYHKDPNGNDVYYAKDSNGDLIPSPYGYGWVMYSKNGASYQFWTWRDSNSDGTLELVSHPVVSFDPTQPKKGFVEDYQTKWMVFAATNFPGAALTHGGIKIYAYDLMTGSMAWSQPFSEQYASSVNDLPGAVTVFDNDGDDFVDQVFVGDNEGRMWALNAADGTNPFGVDSCAYHDNNGACVAENIPLYNVGVGQPIGISPAVARYKGSTMVAFGTGGADWADLEGSYKMLVVNATTLKDQASWNYATGAGTLNWQYLLPQGEKVWASPVIVGGQVIFATATGTMNSADPRNDIDGTGFVRALKLDDMSNADGWTGAIETGKSAGIYVDDGHLYVTNNKGEVSQIGSGKFNNSLENNVEVKRWRQL